MSSAPTRVYAGRLVGLPIFDPQGDQVGKVRDLVAAVRSETSQPRVLGMVAEVFGRRRIFVPMTRVTAIDAGSVYTTGLLNMRRFEQRTTETLVIGQMLDRTVTITGSGVTGTVYDVGMEQARNRDWVLSRVAVQEPGSGFRRRGQTHVAEWGEVVGLVGRDARQGATHLIAQLSELKPADAANMLHGLPAERRIAAITAMDDERLADVLEELPEEDQVEILGHLDSERAADVLEEMSPDDAADLIAQLADMKAADAASVIHDLPLERRTAVVAAMDDERLADVLEELPDEDQVDILEHLDSERAADILEEMSPDDAADLIADLDPETAATLLELMESEDAGNVKRLMSYEEETAGGMMTPEPVILGPDATVAEALAHVRNPDLPVSLAAMVFVCRQPLETPTGKLLGCGHIQRLLREPPSTLVAAALDTSMDTLRPEATIDEVAAHLATYNLVAAPVVDEEGRLLGAVTVDDLLDHMLPEGLRDQSAIGKRGPGVPRG